MDIKYQSKKSSGLLLFLSLVFISLGFALSFENTGITSDKISYFKDNESINAEVIRLAKNLQRYYIYFANFSPEQAEEKLEEIDAFLDSKKYTDRTALKNNILSRSINASGESERFYNSEAEHPEKLYNIDLEDMTVEEIINTETELAEALENYNAVHDYLANCPHFHYYIHNTKLIYASATNSEDFFTEDIYDAISISDNLFNIEFNGQSISKSFSKNDLECTITIPKNNQSSFIDAAVEYTDRYSSISKYTDSPYASVMCYVLGLALLVVVRLYDRSRLTGAAQACMKRYVKIPALLKICLLSFSASFFSVMYYKQYDKLTVYIADRRYIGAILLVLFVFAMLMILFLTLKYIIGLFKHTYSLANEAEIKLTSSIIKDMRFVLTSNHPLWAFVYIIILLSVLALIPAVAVLCLNWRLPPLWICSAVAVYFIYSAIAILVLKFITSYVRLNFYLTKMAEGDLSPIPEENGLFDRPVKDLNNINKGLQSIVDNMLKSKLMETELITNVSHDLKTPLTSIINYVSLLKTLDLKEPKAEEYINVVESKAKRLDILIQDLFEASKLSSGQMELEIMESDIVALIKQTVGELYYKIEQSGIEFVINAPEHPLLIQMDGQRMWRVFDNLVNNITKYSPAGSRAYIDIEEQPDRAVITLKNVSKYKLDPDADELFTRFKRGDRSRTTEGSGLGLSIAKSIVELHGGTISIIIDGDLFKTMIVLYKQQDREQQQK